MTPEPLAPPTFSVAEYTVGELPLALSATWDRLARASGSGGFFASPHFTRTFLDVFGDQVDVSVLTLTDNAGGVAAFLPLMREDVRRGPSFSPRYAYHMTDYSFLSEGRPRLSLPARQISTPFGLEATALRSEIAVESERRRDVISALPAALAELPDWTVALFAFERPDAQQAAAAAHRARVRPLGREMKYLNRVRPAQDLVDLGNKKFRQNARRSAKFAAEAGTGFETIRGVAAVGTAMAEFADLSARSWKAADAGGRAETEDVFIPYTDRQRKFFERLVRTETAEPVLLAARIKGRMISAILMMIYEERCITFLIYSDLSFSRLGVGRLILHEAINFADREGLKEIDYNSNASWTLPYADRTATYDNLVVMAPGPGGLWRYLLSSRV